MKKTNKMEIVFASDREAEVVNEVLNEISGWDIRSSSTEYEFTFGIKRDTDDIRNEVAGSIEDIPCFFQFPLPALFYQCDVCHSIVNAEYLNQEEGVVATGVVCKVCKSNIKIEIQSYKNRNTIW